ncbi:MAG: Lrp/AsnC family transcriptional regulator [Hyphomonadaceae bacterium]|nr:Lrp/AsnC family transcriptional regulator [Hyphomonadaceae bacterium]
MNEKDVQILRCLQDNGRASNAEIATQVNLSESACSRRLRELERSEVIVGYSALIDPARMGLGLMAFLSVTLTSQSEATLAEFEAAASKVEEILECYLMTGTSDYLMRVVVKDVAAFESLHATRLTRLPGVARITSSIAIRTAVRKPGLPI